MFYRQNVTSNIFECFSLTAFTDTEVPHSKRNDTTYDSLDVLDQGVVSARLDYSSVVPGVEENYAGGDELERFNEETLQMIAEEQLSIDKEEN